MSRLRIVEGTTNIITKGEHHIYSDGNINISSSKSVSFKGEDGGVKYGSNPQDAPDVDTNIPFMVKGYWVDCEGNKTQKALVDDSVQFHIKTSNAEGEKIKIKVYDSNLILDKGLSEEFEADVINNEAVFHLKLTKDITKDIRDDGDHLELYCQCQFSNSSQVKKLADDEDNILYLYEVGYYRADNCRIKINENTGELHWVPENCYTITYNQYRQYVEDPNNWTYTDPSNPKQKDVGVANSTLLAQFQRYVDSVSENRQSVDIVNMNNDSGNPNQNDIILHLVQVPPSGGYKPGDKQRKPRAPLTTGGSGRMAGAGLLIVINTVVTILEYAPIIINCLEKSNIEDHFSTLVNNVLNDMYTAQKRGLVNVTQINEYQIYVILNIILFGYEQDDDNLYNSAKEIYRQISNYKKK